MVFSDVLKVTQKYKPNPTKNITQMKNVRTYNCSHMCQKLWPIPHFKTRKNILIIIKFFDLIYILRLQSNLFEFSIFLRYRKS